MNEVEKIVRENKIIEEVELNANDNFELCKDIAVFYKGKDISHCVTGVNLTIFNHENNEANKTVKEIKNKMKKTQK